MKEVAIVIYKDDGQYDVEVFEWVNGGLSNNIQDMNCFALQNEEELNEHIEKVKQLHQVGKIEKVDLSVGESSSLLSSAIGQPDYATYSFDDSQLIRVIEQEIFALHGLKANFSLSGEHNYISIEFDKQTPKDTQMRLLDIYRITDEYDLTDELIADVFSSYANYTYVENEDKIFVHIPFSVALKKFQ